MRARLITHPPSREQIMALDHDGNGVDRLEFIVGMMMRAPPTAHHSDPPPPHLPPAWAGTPPPSTVSSVLIAAQSLVSSCAGSR
jgi:hypothetical protein